MGLALDSSTLIAAEREKRSVIQILLLLEADYAETQIVLSSVTVMDLEHGWYRAQNSEVALQRRRYLDKSSLLSRLNLSRAKWECWPPKLTLKPGGPDV